jgi:hypothetical protein
VFRLLHFLIKYGYYGNSRDVQELQQPLLRLLDGQNDTPFVMKEGKEARRGLMINFVISMVIGY